MPKPGTKSKPDHLKALNGNPGKRKLNNAENKGGDVEDFPPAPSWMDYYAKKEWERTGPRLAKMGLLKEIDLTTFMIYCQRFADWVRAEKSLNKNGQTYISPKGDVGKRPETVVAREAAKQLRMYAENMGLSQAARAGMDINQDNDEPSVEEILKGETG